MTLSASGPDFKETAAAALHSARELLRTWYPAGKFRGREYVVGNLHGDAGDSLSINVETGQWSDFASGDKGGDLVALYAAKHGLSQGDAARSLASGLSISTGSVSRAIAPAPKKVDWIPLPLPENAPEPDLSIYSKVYTYRDATGRPTHYVGRFEATTTRRKGFSGITWGSLNGKVGWHNKQTIAPRSLYGLDRLVADPDAPVIVCEGEKAADAAQILYPFAVAITWACGTNSAGDTDWAPVTGRDVIIWPDNDAPGHKAASALASSLAGVAASVRLLDVSDLPDKADAADVTPDDPSAWLEGRLPPVRVEEDAPEIDEHYMRGLAEHADAMPKDNRGKHADAIDDVVSRFNNRYMVVNEAGKAMVFQPKVDPVLKRRIFDRMAFQDLKNLYSNDWVEVGEADGKPIRKSSAVIWLSHPKRRQFIHGVTFDPSMKNDEPGVLNLWEGYAIKPAPGDWKLMQSHILAIICKGNQGHYEYLLSWMARMLQNPAEQGEVAVVMKGREGTGKGTLAKALMRICGHHGLAISNPKHLVGNFNAHLRDVVFLFADEAFFAGDRSHVGVLKSIITEEYLTVEAKYSNAQQMPNFLHVMMASNEDWVVPASLEARRFMVLEVDDAAKGCHSYFDLLNAEMDGGGLAAMLHDMLARDISGFNVRAVPTTDGLQTQRKLSLGTNEQWWLDCLERGYVFRSKLGLESEFSEWSTRVTTELLFASYLEFARARGERRLLTRETLGKLLVSFNLTQCRIRHGVVGENMATIPGNFGETRVARVVVESSPRGYRLSSLAECRSNFSEITGLSVDWGDSGDVIDQVPETEGS